MKKTTLAILIVLLTTLNINLNVSASNQNTITLNNNNENIVLINQDVDKYEYNLFEIVNNDKAVYLYSSNSVFDLYNYETIQDANAISYYLDENGVFTINKILIENNKETSIEDKNIYLQEHLNQLSIALSKSVQSQTLTNVEDEKNSITHPIQSCVFTDLNADDINDFNVARAQYKTKIIEEDKKGYFVLTSYLYRYKTDEVNFYRVDSSVQFTSGGVALEPHYNDKYFAVKGSVSAKLENNVQYGYGVWYSNQPRYLMHYPQSTQVITSLTSSINTSVNLGKTRTSGFEISETGAGANGSTQFSSSVGLEYLFQSTSQFESPLLSSGELSLSEGVFWTINNWGLDRSVTIYPGIFVEVEPNSHSGKNDGNCVIDVSFEVMTKNIFGIDWDSTKFNYSETIYLDSRI